MRCNSEILQTITLSTTVMVFVVILCCVIQTQCAMCPNMFYFKLDITACFLFFNNRSLKVLLISIQCHPSGLPVAIILKEFSDLILQELKSMRQDLNLGFAKMQENMKDMYSKLLAEVKKMKPQTM